MSTYNLTILKTVIYCERNIINKDEHVVHGMFIRNNRLKGHFRVWRDGERKLVSEVSIDDQLSKLRAVPTYDRKKISSHQEEINEFLSFFETDKEGNNVLKLDIAARAFYLDNYATCARDAGRAIGWHLRKKAATRLESVSFSKIWQRLSSPFATRGNTA